MDFPFGQPRRLVDNLGRPAGDNRIVLEAYPASAVRRLIGRRPYKCEQRTGDVQQRQAARRDLIKAVCTDELYRFYGVQVRIPDKLIRLDMRSAEVIASCDTICGNGGHSMTA